MEFYFVGKNSNILPLILRHLIFSVLGHNHYKRLENEKKTYLDIFFQISRNHSKNYKIIKENMSICLKWGVFWRHVLFLTIKTTLMTYGGMKYTS